MGSCNQVEKSKKASPSQNVPQSQPLPLSLGQTNLREKLHKPKLSELNAPEPEVPHSLFKDMPEYPGNIFKGYGLKRMKAYKCSLNIKDLTQLREDFWGKQSSS